MEMGIGTGAEKERENHRAPRVCVLVLLPAVASASCKLRVASLTILSTSAGNSVRRGARVRTGKHSTERREKERGGERERERAVAIGSR